MCCCKAVPCITLPLHLPLARALAVYRYIYMKTFRSHSFASRRGEEIVRNRACATLCRVKGLGGYTEIALGQGQTQAALNALQAAATAGGWLCIKNTHLAVTWLPELHRQLVAAAASAATGFRLWMTSEPHEMFPSALLSACLVRFNN